MYPVSEAYKNAISQNERNVRIAGTITLKDNSVIQIDDEDILQGSLYFSEQCVSGEDIEIGNVYASEMGLTLTSPPENPYALDGARIALSFGIETSEDVWEYVPLGYFYVTEIERKHTAVNLKALDGMILFDVDLSGVLTSGTPYSMVQSCCTKAGVTLATSSAEFESFANGQKVFAVPVGDKIKTCRDLIMWVCQLLGAFARMNRLGQLEIIPITGRAPVKTISKDERFVSDVSDFYVKISKVSMKVGETEYSQGTAGMTMVLEENPLLAEKTEAEINTVLDEILGQVTQAEYTPCNVDFAGDPALQAGDYINLTGIKVFDKIRATFTRSSVAYLSDGTQVAANQPRFEQGQFGQAVMVEEGTTNLLLYSEDFTQSVWVKARVNVSSAGTYLGYHVTRFTPNTPGQLSAVSQKFLASGAANRTFTWSFWARGQTNRQFHVNFYGGVDGTFVRYAINLTTEWQKFTITHTFPSNATSARIEWGNARPYWGIEYTDWIEVAGVQVEEKPYATSYIKTISTTATRSHETLTIPTAGVLNPQEGTVEILLYVNQAIRDSSAVRRFFEHLPGPGNSNRITMQHNNASYWLFTIGDANGNVHSLSIADSEVADGWRLFAMKWGASEFAVYVDGVKKASISNPTYLPSAVGQNIIIKGEINTLIDDLRISSRARTDEEIAAAYASGQPLPVDELTTLKLSFDDILSGITTAGDSIITHSTWRYRGPHNIKAVGKSALVRGVQAQQTKSVSAVKTVAETAREIAQAANQSTQLIQDAITGYVLIRKNENTGSNEILIMDNPDPAQARKVWRWNMGGLGYSDNVVGVDNPAREYTVAMTMDGAINADFIKTGKLASNVVQIGPETAYEQPEYYTWERYADMTWQEVIDMLGGEE